MNFNNLAEIVNWDLLSVVAYSIVCGLIFGLERHKRNKSVDIRTNIFVCLGAALFTFVSMEIPGTNDNSRVIAQIVTGIGFIGGGVIFKSFSNERLIGLTTASLLWVLAAIGTMIGLDWGKEAVGITILVFIVNIITLKYEQYSYKARQYKKEKNRKRKQLRFKNKGYQNCLNGKKTATVRKGVKQFAIGEHWVVNATHPDQKALVIVRKIERKKYKDIDEKVAKAENYDSLESFKEDFKKFYPEIKDDDTVTIVHFKLKN